VLEIGKVLAELGHTVEFATLDGQAHWLKDYDFVSKTYLMGPGPSDAEYEEHYLRMRKWDTSKGLAEVMNSKYLFDSGWTAEYKHLKAICEDEATKPDFMLADFFVEAVKDMHYQFQMPIATVWPQMPFLMIPCSYIPGQPGFTLDMALTSETMSMWSRIRNDLVVVHALPTILKWVRWTKQMRRRAGVNYDIPRQSKPDYLIFINSFFGLGIPRDLPPLVAAVGPILADTYPPLDPELSSFLHTHKKVLYIALGTHIIISHADSIKIISGILSALSSGLIDGVIWAVAKSGRQDLDRSHVFTYQDQQLVLGDLLDGKHADWTFQFFAPQRAVLEHQNVVLYFTHGGGSSANEALFHGKPAICMGIFSDQIANTARLVAGGVAESLNKFTFTGDELYGKIKLIVEDKEGLFALNSRRLRNIARVASRRKYLAADLIEEVLYDTELRIRDGKMIRPMHLQTADMRMSIWKARNYDIMATVTLSVLMTGSLAWWGTRFILGNKKAILTTIQSYAHRFI